MTCLFNSEDSSDPSDDFVGGGVRGLVQIDDTVSDVIFDVALEGRATAGNGGVVTGTNVKLVVVLQDTRY